MASGSEDTRGNKLLLMDHISPRQESNFAALRTGAFILCGERESANQPRDKEHCKPLWIDHMPKDGAPYGSSKILLTAIVTFLLMSLPGAHEYHFSSEDLNVLCGDEL